LLKTLDKPIIISYNKNIPKFERQYLEHGTVFHFHKIRKRGKDENN